MDEVCKLDRRMRARPAAPALWMAGGTLTFMGGIISLLLVPRFGGEYYAPWLGQASYLVAYFQAGLLTMFGISILLCGILGWRQHDAIRNPPDSAVMLRTAAKTLLALGIAVLLPGVALSIADPSGAEYWEFGGSLGATIFLAMLWLLRMAKPAIRPPRSTKNLI